MSFAPCRDGDTYSAFQSHIAKLTQEIRGLENSRCTDMDITWERPAIGEPANEPTSALSHETSRPIVLAPEIVNETSEMGSNRDNDTSHAVALASHSTADEAVMESPTDALMRMAGVERVIVGSDGRSYALVSVYGKAECRELKIIGERVRAYVEEETRRVARSDRSRKPA